MAISQKGHLCQIKLLFLFQISNRKRLCVCARARARVCMYLYLYVAMPVFVLVCICMCLCLYVCVSMCMHIYVHHAWNIYKGQGEHSRSSFLSLILNTMVYNMYYLLAKPYKDQETRHDINTPWMVKQGKETINLKTAWLHSKTFSSQCSPSSNATTFFCFSFPLSFNSLNTNMIPSRYEGLLRNKRLNYLQRSSLHLNEWRLLEGKGTRGHTEEWQDVYTKKRDFQKSRMKEINSFLNG